MVPLDMRATGSVFYQQPTGEELMSHFSICQKDGISWDLIDTSMKDLEDKYSGEIKLVDRDSFADLIRVVVGSADAVFGSIMTKLGKTFHSTKTIEISNAVWRQMPASVDENEVQRAFLSLKDDLGLNESPERVFGGSDLLDFLTLLNCNYCPLSLQQKREPSKSIDALNSRLNTRETERKETASKSVQESSSCLDASAAMERIHSTSSPLDAAAISESPGRVQETSLEAANIPRSPPIRNRISMDQEGHTEGTTCIGVRGGQFDDPDD
jgi:hypothetical protein